MFDVGPSELLLIVIVAIVVIGPKDLPRVLYKVGQLIGQAKGMARHFRTGVDAMIREAELEELQKQWAKENERIMAESALPDFTGQMTPLADGTAEATTPAQLPPPDEAAIAEGAPGAPHEAASPDAAPEQLAPPIDAPKDEPLKGPSAA